MLSIKYLINLLNDHKDLKKDRHQYYIDSYPALKIESNISYDNLLICLLISYKNIKYNVNNDNFKISVDENVLKEYKQDIQKYIFESSFDQNIKKKQMKSTNYLNQNINERPSNDSILVLTYYFGINLLIYDSESQIIKCYYYDKYMDKEVPFIVIKETKDKNSPDLFYEIVFSQDKFIFDYSHPIVLELIPKAFIVGLEANKQLEFLESNKISETLSDQINENTSTVKLKTLSSKYDKILKELYTVNFNFIKLK